ncbi:AraC family transcriptional regulator [Blautia producta]|uniref:AraC family transcriptional regulator n=1 Tax=Blautia producta TaxID=33035 RepID=UPI001D0237A7|nr:AraC family transcriptional regulator [Blautia producta]MCB5873738.1 AraC family transcriptional regulator [Blautia producta]
MNWIERMNLVMDYVELHLCNEISESEIAKIAACTYSLFSSTFSQITGVSFSEYVRRRKLTCAAYDLQNTNEKIIDIALKYGYQSADSFRVAFKNLHHVSPAVVRKNNVRLTFYCRLYFEVKMKGVERMEYIIAEKDAFKVLGIRKITPYGGGTWAIVKSDGSNDRIKKISGQFFDLGLCFGFGEDGSDDYMCAVEWTGDEVEDFETFMYPPAIWLIFEAKGKISDNILGNMWNRINNEFLPNSSYRKCMATIEKYKNWNEAEDYCHVEIWIPVERK